jgi:SAM-dependent methyltransferase
MAGGIEVYEDALREGRPVLRARFGGGDALTLPLGRWLGEPTPEDEEAVERAEGPVLDVGCGPGRHLVALRERGVEALGIDVSRVAVACARDRGVRAMRGSVFGPVPRPGRWGTALLLDGNVGIGGDPVALLERLRALLRPGGAVVAELEPPGVATARRSIRLEGSDPFAWAIAGVDAVEPLAAEAGFRVADVWCAGARWFADLRA